MAAQTPCSKIAVFSSKERLTVLDELDTWLDFSEAAFPIDVIEGRLTFPATSGAALWKTTMRRDAPRERPSCPF